MNRSIGRKLLGVVLIGAVAWLALMFATGLVMAERFAKAKAILYLTLPPITSCVASAGRSLEKIDAFHAASEGASFVVERGDGLVSVFVHDRPRQAIEIEFSAAGSFFTQRADERQLAASLVLIREMEAAIFRSCGLDRNRVQVERRCVGGDSCDDFAEFSRNAAQ